MSKRRADDVKVQEQDADEVQVVLACEGDEEEEEEEDWIVVNVIIASGEPTKRRGISDRELLDTAMTFASWKRW